jgi:hypothetical protein
MCFSGLVVESIGSEDHLFAVLDNWFTGCKNAKSAFIGVMDSQLVAVQLKFAICTIFNKNSRLSNSSSNDAIL